jgi:hypothetical protein
LQYPLHSGQGWIYTRHPQGYEARHPSAYASKQDQIIKSSRQAPFWSLLRSSDMHKAVLSCQPIHWLVICLVLVVALTWIIFCKFCTMQVCTPLASKVRRHSGVCCTCQSEAVLTTTLHRRACLPQGYPSRRSAMQCPSPASGHCIVVLTPALRTEQCIVYDLCGVCVARQLSPNTVR